MKILKKKIDKALKRNLNKEATNINPTPKAEENPEVIVEAE